MTTGLRRAGVLARTATATWKSSRTCWTVRSRIRTVSGTGSVIRPGDVQKMSAGTGIRHSEFNHSQTDPVHFLQIWIVPDRGGVAPGYQQLSFSREAKLGKLLLVASNEKRDDLIHIQQDAKMYVTVLDSSGTARHSHARSRAGRHGFMSRRDLSSSTARR